jgi:DNA replication protein DnaC
MNLAQERIAELCGQIKLSTVADALPPLAQKAVSNDVSLTEFLESVLKTEVAARLSRQRMTLARVASFPAIKTLDSFELQCRHRCTQGTRSWQAWPSSSEPRTWCSLGQAALAKIAIALGYAATQAGIKVRFITAADLLLILTRPPYHRAAAPEP